MPRPRFNKLAAEKREQIMEAAAKEFAANGYEGASLNKILEEAGVSKGAAYYYFDDKADLFVTAADYYAERALSEVNIDFKKLTRETFWPTLFNIYREMFARLPQEPWMLVAWKASARLSKEARTNPLLADIFNRATQWTVGFFKRGQEVGAVRTDVPDDLLFAILQALDYAGDQWMSEHWEELSTAETQEMILRLAEGIRCMLMPPKGD